VNNLINRFNIKRMIGLSRMALTDEWRPFMWIGVLFFFLTFLSGLTIFRFSADFLFRLMLLAGIMFTSKTFSDLYNKEKGTYLLMIPASTEEKFLIRGLFTLFGFYLFSVLVCILAVEAGNFFSYLVYDGGGVQRQIPTDLIDAFFIFLFFHAVFFAGSLFFKKSSFLKTSLILLGVLFVLLFSAGHYLKNSFMRGRHSQFQFHMNSDDGWQFLFGDSASTSFTLLKIVIFIAIPLILYGISYLRFRKFQLKG
jgi:hypothetical protein